MPAPYDYLCFCLFSILCFVGLQTLTWRAGAPLRLRLLAASGIVAVLATGWPLTQWWGDSTRLGIEHLLTGYAATYAGELEVLGHSTVRVGTSPTDPRYLRMIDAQRRWLKANPSANDIYTFRRDPDGTVRLIVDSETDYDHNGRVEGEREQRTVIGESYDASDLPNLTLAFAGQTLFDRVPFADRWGTWVSAYRPLRAPDGRVDGVLGVDFDAGRWAALIARARWTAMGYLFALIFVLSIGSHMLATLDRHRQLALAGARARSQFLANMSHELRTPLTGVVGVARLLLDTPLAENQRGLVRTISDSSDSLLTLIDEIMDLSKVEAGRMELEQIPFDLRAALEDIVVLLRTLAEAKGLTIELVYGADAPIRLVGDPARIRQVVMNLVGNAIKFTERGSIRVVVEACGGTPTRSCLKIAVLDTGIGISPEAHGLVFEQFRQADDSTSRRFGGTGLGLAISQQLVGLMGSRIEIESAPGAGSCFWFVLELPVAEAAPETVVSANFAQALTPLAVPRHVLLVEDNAVNQLVAGHMLRKLGCTFDLAIDGRQALDMLEARLFDIVLMDCLLPELDGFETTVEWRRREGTERHIPIVAMTANAMSEDRERCLQAGMDDHLTKPIQLAVLSAALERWVNRSRAA